MSGDVLLYEVSDGIAHITLNRPDKLNALNTELANALREVWTRLEQDQAAKVAILSGAGKSFCAGRDVSPGAVDDGVPFLINRANPRNGETVFKPIVGAVHGNVMGAGFALGVKSCDITIAADTAMFAYPEARVGLAITPPQYTPYLPFKVSLEFALLAWKGGRPLDAQRAYSLGLVNTVVPESDLLTEAKRWAELLKEVPPLYIRAVKRGHYQAVRTRVQRREEEYMDFVWPQEKSQDLKEAGASFREKRKPKFTGR